MRRYRDVITLCIVMLLSICGCGRKTPPIPPQAAIPAPIQDLRGKLDEKGIALSWTCPSRTVSGEKIEGLKTFKLFKSEAAVDDFCPDCPVNFDMVITLNGAGIRPGSVLTYTDTDLKKHHYYTYKVIAGAGWDVVSDDSNKVSFRWESPLPPPIGLALQIADRRLILSWDPVTELFDGSPIAETVRYQVYRSNNGREFKKIGEPVEGVSIVDEDVTNDRKYFYRVRAVRIVGDSELPGIESEVIAGTARELSPPVAPAKLTVVTTSEGAKLLWENIAQPGVAGFRIYRRMDGETEMKLVGETERASFSFVDKNLPEGNKTLYYALTAFDEAVPPNESAFSAEVALTR